MKWQANILVLIVIESFGFSEMKWSEILWPGKLRALQYLQKILFHGCCCSSKSLSKIYTNEKEQDSSDEDLPQFL